MRIDQKSLIISCLLLVGATGAGTAAVVDFEDFDLAGATFLDVPELLVLPNVQGSGVTVTITAGANNRIYDLFLYGGNPAAVGQALIDWPWPLGSNPTGTLFEFDSAVADVSIRAGDMGGDSDSPLTLEAYDEFGGVIGSASASWPSDAGPPFVTLSITGTGIRSVRYRSGGSYAGSTFMDDLTFTPGGVPVANASWGSVKSLFR